VRIPDTPQNPDPADFMAGGRLLDILRAQGSQEYESFVAWAQDRYLPWDKVRRIAPDRGLDPELAWAMIRFRRSHAHKRLPFRSTSGQPLVYMLPDDALRELLMIDQHLAGLVSFADEEPMSHDQGDRYIISALMEEAIASSQLEGASTTHQVAKDMLRSGRKPRTIDERMIVNNYHGIEFVRENRGERLTVEFIVELQSILTEGTLDDPGKVGRFRRQNERVVVDDPFGTVLHEPPPASELPERLELLCNFANTSTVAKPEFIHPVLRAIFVHFQLAYEHPFCDGNGRTARLLFYWSMLRSGYWLCEYLAISSLIRQGPSKYARAYLYTETDGFDGTYFLVYHLDVIRRARKKFREYLREKQHEATLARQQFSGDNDLNHRQQSLLLHALRHPHEVYTIEGHQRTNAISYATARADLLRLEEKGYLIKFKSGNRFDFTPGPAIQRAAAPPTSAREAP